MPNLTEIIFNDVMYAQPGGMQIKAGQMVVLPSAWCDEANKPNPQIDGDEIPSFPEFLIVSAGQSLKRELYPGWSAEYQGGFYDFTLPNLHGKFIMGFDQDGEPIKGSGCVYIVDIPEIPQRPPHDVRQMV